jgi:hypothetical protein
LSNPVDV